VKLLGEQELSKVNPQRLRKSAWSLTAIALVFGTLFVPAVKAGPLFFSDAIALQNDGFTSVPLFSNPGVVLQDLQVPSVGPWIIFEVTISGVVPAGGSDTIRGTYTQAGVSQVIDYPIPDNHGTLYPPFIEVFGFHDIGSYQGVPTTLTFDLLSSGPDFVIPSGPNAGQQVNTYTYAFTTQLPIPEPNTAAMMAAAAFLWAAKITLSSQKMCRFPLRSPKR